MSKLLMVPIHVDGLFQSEGRGKQAVAPMADFSQLPYVEKTKDGTYRDVNPHHPWLSETVLSEPFNDDGFWLGPGVHIHWALPDALTIGRHKRDADGQVDHDQLEFPTVPNRWLVRRWLGGLAMTAWLVESDYLWPADFNWTKLEQEDAAKQHHRPRPITYPYYDAPHGEPPFRHMGRYRKLNEEWLQTEGTGNYLADIGERLTAVGYGESTFAAFYPNCHGVFGLYDFEAHDASQLWYEVYGWYDKHADDPLQRFKHDPNDAYRAEAEQMVDHLEEHLGWTPTFQVTDEGLATLNDSDKTRGWLSSPEKLAVLKEKLGQLKDQSYRGKQQFLDALGLTNKQLLRPYRADDDHTLQTFILSMAFCRPERIICYGQVRRSGFVAPAPAEINNMTIAVANTGTEAVSAFLADRLAAERYPAEPEEQAQEKRLLERHLEALHLADGLRSYRLDIGAKLEMARHEKTFHSTPGSKIWRVRPKGQDKSGKSAKADESLITQSLTLYRPADTAHLDDSLAAQAAAHDINALNAAQTAYDRAQRRVEAQRWQLYSDWYRYMHNCYPPTDMGHAYQASRSAFNTSFSDFAAEHDIDHIIQFLRRTSLGDLYQAQIAAGSVDALTGGRQPTARYYLSREMTGGVAEADTGLPFITLQLETDGWHVVADANLALAQNVATQLKQKWADANALPQPLSPTNTLDQWHLPTADGIDMTLYLVAGVWCDPTTGQACGLAESAAQRLARAYHKIQIDIDIHNSREEFQKDTTKQWILDTQVGPRYWTPNEPTIFINGPAAKATDRHGDDGSIRDDGLLGCHVVESDTLDLSATTDASTLIKRLSAQAQAIRQADGHQIGTRSSNQPQQHPFMLEWIVDLAPIRQSGNIDAANRRYQADFVRRNWDLGETQCEITQKPGLTTMTGAASHFRGRSLLTPYARTLTKTRLETYILERLQEKVIPAKDDAGRAVYISYFEQRKVPLKAQNAAYLQANYIRIHAWIIRSKAERELRAAAAGLLELHDEPLLGGPIEDERVYGLPNKGPMAGGLLEIVNRYITMPVTPPAAGDSTAQSDGDNAAKKPKSNDPIQTLVKLVGLDTSLVEPLKTHRGTQFASLRELDDVLKGPLKRPEHPAEAEDDAPEPGADDRAELPPLQETISEERRLHTFVRLLRYADANGFIGAGSNRQEVLSHASVYGLPDGGAIARAILYVANRARPNVLLHAVGVTPMAAEAIESTRDIQEFGSLSQLMSLWEVTASDLARLLIYANKSEFLSLSADDIAGPNDSNSWADEYGHAWIDPILTAFEALHYLQLHPDMLSQNLTNFNDALLMRRHGWQLPIGDPTGFADYEVFTEKLIKPAVGDANHSTPLFENDFYPIRSGDLRLTQLRLIDTFGQSQKLHFNDVLTTEQMTSERPQHVTLPPRLTQATRLNFRWLAADGDGTDADPMDDRAGRDEVEWNSHPVSSPICGWVLPNVLEGRLMIYATSGRALGSVDGMGRWRSAPGGGGLIAPAQIANTHLRRLVSYLCRQGQLSRETVEGGTPTFIETLTTLVESALEYINPENYEHEQAKSVLMGRPLVLVRAAVSIELQEPFAVQQHLQQFRHELRGEPRNTNDFERVQFPVRVGEHMRFQDSVIGYWVEDDNGYATTYELNEAALASIKREDIPTTVYDSLVTLRRQGFTSRREFMSILTDLLGPDDTARYQDLIFYHSNQGTPFYAPQTEWVDDKGFEVYREKDGAFNLWLDLQDPPRPRKITVLMDPSGSLHATCGVLPTKVLTLPADQYVPIMKAINVTFLTAPVLSDHGRINLPLPAEPGWDWSWEAIHKRQWVSVPSRAVIDRSAILKAFPNGEALWTELLAKEWLKPHPDDVNRAYLYTTKEVKALSRAIFQGYEAADVLQLLDTAAKAIGPVYTNARFVPQSLQEGWLKLSPVTTLTDKE